jgi:hypothetical protein
MLSKPQYAEHWSQFDLEGLMKQMNSAQKVVMIRLGKEKH